MGNGGSRTCFASSDNEPIIDDSIAKGSLRPGDMKDQAKLQKPVNNMGFSPCITRAHSTDGNVLESRDALTPKPGTSNKGKPVECLALPEVIVNIIGNLDFGGHRELFCQQIYDSFRPLILRMRMSQSATASYKEVQECFEVLGLSDD